jgi:tRNA-modifying protein YgfZ
MSQGTLDIPTANDELYRAAHEAVVRVEISDHGVVRMSGRDRAGLLQRLTTNDIERLTPGSGARTVLVNHNARILDLLTVYALPEHLLLLPAVGNAIGLGRFLQSKVFFNDQVTIEDLSPVTIGFSIYGPQAATTIRDHTSIDPRDWPLHHIQAAQIGDAPVWIARTLPLGGDGFAILAQRDDENTINDIFAQAPLLDAATLDVLRIEAGYSAPRRELSTEYIPLETGLHDAVSFSKGCYVGQEIIARMESRNRLAKRLMGLRLQNAIAPGGNLRFEGREAGDLTSVAISPRLGPIGLGYVRTVAAAPGTIVQLPDGSDAEVVELPFPASR